MHYSASFCFLNLFLDNFVQCVLVVSNLSLNSNTHLGQRGSKAPKHKLGRSLTMGMIFEKPQLHLISEMVIVCPLRQCSWITWGFFFHLSDFQQIHKKRQSPLRGLWRIPEWFELPLTWGSRKTSAYFWIFIVSIFFLNLRIRVSHSIAWLQTCYLL